MMCSVAFAETLKISGSGSAFRAMKDHVANVEKDTGVKLEIKSSSSGKGLVDLDDGTVSISMLSEPIDLSLEAAKEAGKEVKKDSVKVHHLMDNEMIVMVNKANKVEKLTEAQVKDIFTGKIKNWKEVGGNDAPIIVMTDCVGSGTATWIKAILMKGAAFGSNHKEYESSSKGAQALEIIKDGITSATASNLNEAFSKNVNIGKTYLRPISLATKGDAKGDVEKVVKAFQKYVK